MNDIWYINYSQRNQEKMKNGVASQHYYFLVTNDNLFPLKNVSNIEGKYSDTKKEPSFKHN